MNWFHFKKIVQGRITSENYLQLDYENEEQAKDECEEWSERVDSCGSNRGYRYEWELIDKPPIEWIDKKIIALENYIENSLNYIIELKELKNKV